MSTLHYSFNPAAWDFKPRQEDKPAMQDVTKASPSVPTYDEYKIKFLDDNTSDKRSPIPPGGFRKTSFEERRLKDYNQGKGKLDVNGAATFKHSAAPKVSFLASVSSANQKILDLLRGGGIDIHVGTSALPCDQWSLPINLISHYSPYLKAASTSNDEGPLAKINLPEHDPAVFGLFVEWMYYGRYDTLSLAPDPHIHAKCWILGDTLECPEFMNFVMGLLYTQHITLPFAKSVTCEEVQYVCDNTSSSAKLRQYYENLVVSYYATTGKLLGSTEDWDALFQKQPGMRVALLQSMRQGFTEGSLVKDLSAYQESTEGLLKPDIKPNEDSTTSPTEDKTGEAAQSVKVQDGLEWTFDPKGDEAAAGLPSRVKTVEKEEEEESQTGVDGKAQDEVRQGAFTMHHVPQVDAGSPSTIKGSEQEDTDETLVNAQPGPKSKRKKNKRNKAKGYLVNKTAEHGVGDDQQADRSSSEHDTEQVRI